MFSLATYLKRTAKPDILSRMPDPADATRKFSADPGLAECPQLKILRINGDFFFGSVAHIRETLSNIKNNNPKQKNLLLLVQSVNLIDVSGAELISEEVEQRKKLGGKVFFYSLKDTAREVIERGNYLQGMGPEAIFFSKGEAIKKIFTHRDKDICKHCDKRIFKECQAI